ncbi:MAG: acyl-CoA dehydrogenase family protein [Devosia sp.]|nr:acyl-CoA dehydrogenase family protein [Devosia sp.]
MGFSPTDPFGLDDRLTDAERAFRDAAAGFAATTLAPRIVRDYRDEASGRAIVEAFGGAGLLGLLLPTDDGGRGASHTAFGLVCREIERVDSGYRTALMAQEALVLFPIHAFGDDAQRAKYLPGLISGKSVGCFGFTEPEAGSDPSGMTTRAEKVAGGYRLSGRKVWITSAPIADLFVVWAKSDAHGGQLRGFVLERGMPGLSTPAAEGRLSLRASSTGDIVMDGVVVPEANLLAGAAGIKAAFECLNRARFGTAWGVLGAAEDCFARALAYGLGRSQFGKPLAATQLYQKKLADMVTEIALATQASLRLARLLETTGAAPELASLVKRNNCRKAIEIARMARDMLGANGIADGFGVMRHAQNLESVSTYEGTDDVQALILGRAITGLAAFS